MPAGLIEAVDDETGPKHYDNLEFASCSSVCHPPFTFGCDGGLSNPHGGTQMLMEYLAEAMIEERRREWAAHALSQRALVGRRSPNALRWLVNYAFEPWTTPSRARSARSTSGHSFFTTEK